METSEPNEFVKLVDYWITGKNDRQTSAIKTEMLLTYQDLYLTYKFTISISITTI
jgi:hypothetical protein